MAKVFGLGGNVSGRAGSYVFRVRGGKTIMSQYNPIVSNPDSKGQSDQRAKFKLLTQLGAVLRGAYGFGTLSVAKRKTKMTQANAFFKKNYQNVQITEESGASKAETSMALLQLTDGTLPLSVNTIAIAASEDNVSARLSGIFDYVTQVRCVVIRRMSRQLPDNTEEYYYVQSFNEVQDVMNNEVTFETNVPRATPECVIYMYGYMQTSTNKTNLDRIDSELDNNENWLANVQVNEKTNLATANTTTTIGVSFS